MSRFPRLDKMAAAHYTKSTYFLLFFVVGLHLGCGMINCPSCEQAGNVAQCLDNTQRCAPNQVCVGTMENFHVSVACGFSWECGPVMMARESVNCTSGLPFYAEDRCHFCCSNASSCLDPLHRVQKGIDGSGEVLHCPTCPEGTVDPGLCLSNLQSCKPGIKVCSVQWQGLKVRAGCEPNNDLCRLQEGRNPLSCKEDGPPKDSLCYHCCAAPSEGCVLKALYLSTLPPPSTSITTSSTGTVNTSVKMTTAGATTVAAEAATVASSPSTSLATDGAKETGTSTLLMTAMTTTVSAHASGFAATATDIAAAETIASPASTESLTSTKGADSETSSSVTSLTSSATPGIHPETKVDLLTTSSSMPSSLLSTTSAASTKAAITNLTSAGESLRSTLTVSSTRAVSSAATDISSTPISSSSAPFSLSSASFSSSSAPVSSPFSSSSAPFSSSSSPVSSTSAPFSSSSAPVKSSIALSPSVSSTATTLDVTRSTVGILAPCQDLTTQYECHADLQRCNQVLGHLLCPFTCGYCDPDVPFPHHLAD